MSSEQLERMVRENVRRRAEWDRPYDPKRGIGCWGTRVEAQIDHDAEPVHLPEAMMEERVVQQVVAAGGIEPLARNGRLTPEAHAKLIVAMLRLRCRYDPEFWFSSAVRIKTKREGYQQFVLFPAQRKLFRVLAEDFFAGKPVRVILVKARQWGGSTLVQLFCAWIQVWRREFWNLAIVADVQSQSAHIRSMFTGMAEHHPDWAGDLALEPYQNQTNVRILPSRHALVGVASAKSPNAVRSYTYHMLHLSEVGIWKSTREHNAEDLAQALKGGLVGGPHTVCVLESTAKGVGNFFHREYQAAAAGKSSYTPVFVGWHEIQEYTMPVPRASLQAFVSSWTEREEALWELGATIEGIRWYRQEMGEMPAASAEVRMQEEYPTTAEEAFQSSGRPAFRRSHLQAMEKHLRPPVRRGYLMGRASTGPEALDNIEWVDHNEKMDDGTVGRIWLWDEPGATCGGLLDTHRCYVRGRYCGFLDIGARWSGGDYHVLTILDRAWMLFDLPLRVVAQYRCHADIDLAAWEAVQLCTHFDRAFLAIEKNSLTRANRGDRDIQDHQTVLDELAEVYADRLYFTEKHDDLRQEKYRSFGFHTNRETKPMLVNTLAGALRDELYLEPARLALDEMLQYERTDSGTYEAAEGQHDDVVVSRAGALYVALKAMDPPRLIERTRKRKERIVTASSFA